MKYSTPITPSTRHLIQIDRNQLEKKQTISYKNLSIKLDSHSGRNNQGIITIRRKGGGHKKLYRIIDIKKRPISNLRKEDFVVQQIQYDPYRTSFICLIQSQYNSSVKYVTCPHGLKTGDQISFYSLNTDLSEININVGNSIPLRHIPVGTQVYDVELKPNKGSQLIKAAGTSGMIVQKDLQLKENGPIYSQIRLPSGEMRMVLGTCYASIGVVSNLDHQNISLGKAGRNRWLGHRPRVRGVAMNPVDHPHGGGEGKTSGGRPSVTPQGRLTKGKPTRSKSKSNRLIISKTSSIKI